MSLISDDLKTEINNVLDSVHDTFKREIYVFVEKKPEIPVASDYNPLYDRSPSIPQTPTKNILTRQAIEARIYYPDRALENEQGLFGIPMSTGRIRIKVDTDGYELLKQAVKIEVDEFLYTLAGDPHVEGPFDSYYYSIYLERIN